MPKDGELAGKVVAEATGEEHKTTRPSTIGTENGAMTMPLTLVGTVNETAEVHMRWPDLWGRNWHCHGRGDGVRSGPHQVLRRGIGCRPRRKAVRRG